MSSASLVMYSSSYIGQNESHLTPGENRCELKNLNVLLLIKLKQPASTTVRNRRVFPDRREKEKAYTVEDMGEGVATTWSARPVAHLGPIKETLKPRPPHALMHDAHSPVHGNEYYFTVMLKTDASFA